MTTEIKYKSKSGVVLSGTIDQVLAILKITGEELDLNKLEGADKDKYYLSSSKGLVKISDMNTKHIQNVICQKLNNYFSDLRTTINKNKGDVNIRTFFEKLEGWTKEVEINNLVNELNSRL